jgi:hypothetical protein
VIDKKKTAKIPQGICEIRTYTNGRRTVVGLHPRTEGPLGTMTEPTPVALITEAHRGQVGFQVQLPAETPEQALNMPDDEWEAAIVATFEMIKQKMSLAHPGPMPRAR